MVPKHKNDACEGVKEAKFEVGKQRLKKENKVEYYEGAK